MPRTPLTGSRIREHRLAAGMRQAQLAQAVGISPSYLNLIEHNRRRIGGKILVEIARALGVEPQRLSEGAAAGLVEALRDAAAAAEEAAPERDRTDEFAGRFPGWAALVVEQKHRIDRLQQSVLTLSDRLGHDPFLAASLHDMLSTITAIRSTAAILAGPDEVEPAWRARFDRNINEDSRRLAETSQELVAYLDNAGDASGRVAMSPQEEVFDVLDRIDHHLPALEEGAPVERVADDLCEGLSRTAQEMLRSRLREWQRSISAMPLAVMAEAVAELGIDPAALGKRLGMGPVAVMRRLAQLPRSVLPTAVGLVVCDASGAILHRRQLPEFPVPRHGAACPLWPLFTALTHPGLTVRERLVLAGRDERRFLAFAMAEPAEAPTQFGQAVRMESVMLVVLGDAEISERTSKVGTSCRICVRTDCPARREPSVLTERF